MFSYAQGIEFQSTEWKEALSLAKEQEKLLFVDSYTTWCGPCKKLSKYVFPDAKVGEMFNSNFVSIKLDMEKKDGISFGKKYPVSAYPTMYFISGDGEVVHKIKGYRKAQDLIAEGERALGKFDNSEKYSEQYEKGERNFEFMLKYISELNKANKESLKIANEYLKENQDLTEDQRAEFLFAAAKETDSSIFEEMISSKETVLKIKSKKEFESKVLTSAKNTVDKAIEYDYQELALETIEIVKQHVEKSSAESFEYKSMIKFGLAQGNQEQYLESMKKYNKKVCKKDVAASKWAIHSLMNSFRGNSENLVLAEDIAKNLLKQEDIFENLVSYTKLLMLNGKKDKARELVQDSIKKTKKKGSPTAPYESILKRINQTR